MEDVIEVLSYKAIENELLDGFNAKGFERLYRTPQHLRDFLDIENDAGIDLKIWFPGLKTARRANGALVYDYRVDLKETAISHVNVVVDLYNKTRQRPDMIRTLYSFLRDLFRVPLSGLGRIDEIDGFDVAPISSEELQSIDSLHRKLGKNYNRHGNMNWNYSANELRYVISYIVLQEDINYPPPKYEGRRMPFYRYIEAIMMNEPTVDTPYTLDKVIARTLSHNRPRLYDELEDIYFRELSEDAIKAGEVSPACLSKENPGTR